MKKNAQKTQFKIERKNLLNHNTKVVLIAFFEKQRYRKLNFFHCLDTIATKILSPKIWMNEIFSQLFFINLET